MPTKERRVSIYRGQLKYLDTTLPGQNQEVDSDVYAAMRHIQELPWNRNLERNVYMFAGDIAYALRVDDIDEDDGIIKGQFATIDRGAIPQYEQNGVVDSVQIPIDAGLYYPSHFIYFPQHRHIAMEYNQSGPKPKQLQEYLEDKLKDEGLLTTAFFHQIIREDVVDAIEHMGSIAEVYIEVKADNVEAFLGSPYYDTLNFAARNAPEGAVLKLGISREKGARDGQVIEKPGFLRWLRPRANVEVPGAKLKARVEDEPDDSGSSIWLDLFSQNYADKVRVRMNANKSIDSEDCYEQIQRIYNRMMNP